MKKMPKGNKCPVCRKQTLHETYKGRFQCTNCGFTGARGRKR